MTKLIFTIIALLTITTATFGQKITYEDFKEVIPSATASVPLVPITMFHPKISLHNYNNPFI
ncbi:hypothetical protein [Flavobacterium sp.]|uniref:hypothetical protein n=1 Tax=Flavobacterium sp. TaxID=239 RepID=UPI0022BD4B8A|nr:hypothetical protein [Flavobacterium sp.]MCZ8229271.1 hypothetical protein [Flavobacterium sp.]